MDADPGPATTSLGQNGEITMPAGEGVRQGVVVGSSDKEGGFPKDRPVSPAEVIATILELAGVNPQTLVTKEDGRPIMFVDHARAIPEVLA